MGPAWRWQNYGKSDPSIEPTMTVERMTDDGIEVAQFLAEHLNKKKIIIYGGSWGSILAFIWLMPDRTSSMHMSATRNW